MSKGSFFATTAVLALSFVVVNWLTGFAEAGLDGLSPGGAGASSSPEFAFGWPPALFALALSVSGLLLIGALGVVFYLSDELLEAWDDAASRDLSGRAAFGATWRGMLWLMIAIFGVALLVCWIRILPGDTLDSRMSALWVYGAGSQGVLGLIWVVYMLARFPGS